MILTGWHRVIALLTAFWHVVSQADVNNCCTEGFFTENELRSTSTAQSAPNIPLRGIHPTFRVTCNGTLTKIFYVSTSAGEIGQEYFEIWRRVVPDREIYRISSTFSRNSEVKVAMLGQNLALYSIEVNYSVLPGDFIGFAASDFTTLKFFDLDNGVQVLFLSTTSTQISLEAVSILERRYDPLITAIVTPLLPCSGTATTMEIATAVTLSQVLIRPSESSLFSYLSSPTSSIAIHPTPVVTSTLSGKQPAKPILPNTAIHPTPVVTSTLSWKPEQPAKLKLSFGMTVTIGMIAGVFCLIFCLVPFFILIGYALHKRKSRNCDDTSTDAVGAVQHEQNLYTQVNHKSKVSNGDDGSMISNPLYNECKQKISMHGEKEDPCTSYETITYAKLSTKDDSNYSTLKHLGDVALDFPGSAEYSQLNGYASPEYINKDIIQTHASESSLYNQISREGEEDGASKKESGSLTYAYCEIPTQLSGDTDTYIEINGAYLNS